MAADTCTGPRWVPSCAPTNTPTSPPPLNPTVLDCSISRYDQVSDGREFHRFEKNNDILESIGYSIFVLGGNGRNQEYERRHVWKFSQLTLSSETARQGKNGAPSAIESYWWRNFFSFAAFSELAILSGALFIRLSVRAHTSEYSHLYHSCVGPLFMSIRSSDVHLGLRSNFVEVRIAFCGLDGFVLWGVAYISCQITKVDLTTYHCLEAVHIYLHLHKRTKRTLRGGGQ